MWWETHSHGQLPVMLQKQTHTGSKLRTKHGQKYGSWTSVGHGHDITFCHAQTQLQPRHQLQQNNLDQ